MLNYGVYLVIPGINHLVYEEDNGLYTTEEVDATRYTLYRSGNEDKDFIDNLSLSLEVNKAGTFSFSILPSHTYYSMLRRYIHYISVEDLDDNEVLFYGRIYSIDMSFNGEKNISCEGAMANLLDSPMYNVVNYDILNPTEEIFKIEGTPGFLFEAAIRAYRNLIRPDIDVGTAFNAAYTYEEEKYDLSGGQTVADFILNELVGSAGGYIVPRYVKNEGGNIRTFIDWIADAETEDYSDNVNPQEIEFGINMLDIEAEFANDDIITGIIPSWTDENDKKHWAIQVSTDIDNPNGTQILKPYISMGNGTGGIGIQIIDLPELTDQSEAMTAARKYSSRYCNYDLSTLEFDSFRIKALDMHYFSTESPQKIFLCDQVRVVSDYHGINGVYTCTAMEINLENQSENQYTMSIYRPKASSNDKSLCRQLGIKKSKKRKVHND